MYNKGTYVYRKQDNKLGTIVDINDNSEVVKYLVTFEEENGVSQRWYKEIDLYTEEPSDVEYVNHPKHYSNGKYECIEVMRDVFGDEAVKTFCMLNAFKYTWRAGKKNGNEDVKKATWYLEYASKL